MADAPAPVVTKSGKVGYLPADLAKEAGGSVRPASDKELRGAQVEANKAATEKALRDKFENAGLLKAIEGTLAPAAAGAARGLTLGGSDQAAVELGRTLGGEEGAQGVAGRLSEYKEYAPVSSTLGELGAIAGASLVGDEAGVGALPGLIGRLGEGAGAATTRALGGGALARGAGTLARGAVEGGIYGAGNAVSEAALSNTDLSGQALIANGVQGAAFGAALSGGLGLLGAGGRAASESLGKLRAPKAGDFEAVARNEFGEAAPGLGEHLTGATKGAADYAADGTIAAAARGDAGKASDLANVWRNRQVAFDNASEAVEKHSRDFSRALDDQISAGHKVDVASFGDAKTNQMSILVDRAKVAAQQEMMSDFAAKTSEIIDALKKDGTSGLGPSGAKRIDAQMTKLYKAIGANDSLEMFTQADQLKRFLGKESGFGRSKFGQSIAEKEFDGLYHDLMGRLESSEVWGKAGAAQKDVNAATQRMLSEGKLFTRKFTTEFGSEAGHPLYAADTSAVSGLMGRLTSSANDLDAKAVNSYIGARRQFLDAVSKNYTFGPNVSNGISAERASLDALEKTFKKAGDQVSLINQVKKLQGEEMQSGIGGLVGALTGVATRPVTTLKRIAQIEGITNDILSKSKRGVGRLLGSAEKAESGAPTLAPPKRSGFFSSLLDSAPKAARAAATAAPTRTKFQQSASAIAYFGANTPALTDRVGQVTAPYSGEAPKVTGAATATAMRGMAYLSSILPPSRTDPYSLQPQLDPASRASDAEIAKFMRSKEAIDHPTIILDAAKSGTLTRDQVDAVKAVYPELYDQMRSQVMTSLVGSKSQLPYDRRIQLGILLDIPTDKTLAPDFLQAIQATYSSAEKAGAESPPPTLSRPINVANSLQTATQTAQREGLER